MNKLLILLLATLLILGTVAGGMACNCNNSGGSNADVEFFMGKIPDGVSDFTFMDLETLRGVDYLEDISEDIIDDLEQALDEIGIDINDIKSYAIYQYGSYSYRNAGLLYSDFNLEDIREELDDLGYDMDDYKGVEIWESDDRDTWVALKGNLIIFGCEEDVKNCVDVIEDGKDSMLDDNDCRYIMDTLSGFMVIYSIDEEYYGSEVNGASYQKKDDDTLIVTGVFKFEDKDAAEDAVGEIENELDDEGFDAINVYQDGKFVITSCERNEVISGKYMNQDDSGDYVKIKADGTFYTYIGGMITVGYWGVDGNVIDFLDDNDESVSLGTGIVEGDQITDASDAVWVWTNTDDIEVTAGTYMNQDGSGDYVEIKVDGTYYLYQGGGGAVGEWDVNGNQILFFQKDKSGNLLSVVSGVVEGDQITDASDAVWVLEE